MRIKIPLTVASSVARSFTNQAGELISYVELSVMLAGIGIARITCNENRIPDEVEGKSFTGLFEIRVDKNFKPSLKFIGVE